MVHTVEAIDRDRRILLVAVSNPVSARVEGSEIMKELEAILGTVTNTVYIIYDLSKANISFSDLVDGISSGSIVRAATDFDKQLDKYSRMVLVGVGTIVSVGAKTISRFAPDAAPPVFKTSEEALEYARAELAKQGKQGPS